jgi:UDP-N-acetylglucosamine--N-acetylmuramyl-(pentapeptide) pyrophosphoryl-undecaprenol N-acetylglucosamine transferase
MKILITGGHLTPAMAVIDELVKHKDIEIIFVGRKYNLDSEKSVSLEYKEIIAKHIPFISLQAGRLTRILTFRSLRNLVRIPLGFINAFKIIKEQEPQLVLSFGGYLALPIAFWAWIFKIPVFTHEQTISPGLANKIIGIFAKKIFVAFSESQKYFEKNKTILVGNPIRKTIFTINKKPFNIIKYFPVIYITGGSLGSQSINEHIMKILKSLLEKYIVIHQTGSIKEFTNIETMKKLVKKLPMELQKRYFVADHFTETELGYVYSICDLVISRAGANTFFELLMLKKPAIFIPLPWSGGGEQEKHAEIFAKARTGKIFLQHEKSEVLLNLITEMINNKEKYIKNFKSLQHLYKHNASQFIAQTVLSEIS